MGDFSSCPCCSGSHVSFSYDLRGPTKAGSGGMMNVVGLGTGAKSMMSLWLLNPASLARRLCLLRLTKKKTNPTVQASRTQAPETDPAIIGVLAFCLDYKPHRRQRSRVTRWNREQVGWIHIPMESSSLGRVFGSSCLLEWWCGHNGGG